LSKHAPIQVVAAKPKCPFLQTRTYTGRGNNPKVPVPSNTHLDHGNKSKVPVPSNTHLFRSWQQIQSSHSFKHAPIQVVATNPKCPFLQTRTYTGRGINPKSPFLQTRTYTGRGINPKCPFLQTRTYTGRGNKLTGCPFLQTRTYTGRGINPKCPFLQTRTFTGRGSKSKVLVPSNTHLNRK